MRTRSLYVLALVLVFCVSSWSSQLRQIAIIDVPGRPGFNGVAIVDGYLVISHDAAGTLDIFSLPQRRLVTQVAGMKGPAGIAVDQPGAKIYVANSEGKSIAVISTRTWHVLETIPVPHSPQGLLLASSGQLYAANPDDQSISQVDLAHGNRVSTADVGGQPQYMAYDARRNLLFATVQDLREVIALDQQLKVVNRYKVAGSQPTGLVLDAKARRLYVAVRYAVLALDADTGAESSRVATPAGTDMLRYDEPSSTLYAAAASSISVIRAGSGKLVNLGELATEVRGHVLAFDPATNLIYLPGGREGRSKLLILKRIGLDAQPAEQVAQGSTTR